MILKRLSINKLTIDFLLTFTTSILTIFGVLFINAYISRVYGLELLGEYLLVWRFVTSLVGVFLIGMNISLPYYLPRDYEKSIVNTAFTIILSISIPMLLLVTYFLSVGIVPGISPNNSIAYLIFSVGITFKTIVYGYFRGTIKMFTANILQIITISVVPILTILIFNRIDLIYYSIGFSMIVFTISFFLYQRKSIPKIVYNIREIKKILNYGLKRIIGILGEAFLLTGIPILLAKSISFSQLAYITSSLSVVRIFLVVVGPIGVILLPRISKALDLEKIKQVQNGIELLIKFSITFGSIISIFLVLFGNSLFRFWLGSSDIEGIQNLNLIFLSIPFFIIFKILNSPINAISTKGYISRIYLVTAIVLYASYKILILINIPFIESGIISIVLSYFLASLLSLYILKIKLNVRIIDFSVIFSIIIINLFQFMIYILNTHIFNSDIIQMLIHLLSLTVFVVLYFVIKKESWIIELRDILLKSNRSKVA